MFKPSLHTIHNVVYLHMYKENLSILELSYFATGYNYVRQKMELIFMKAFKFIIYQCLILQFVSIEFKYMGFYISVA